MASGGGKIGEVKKFCALTCIACFLSVVYAHQINLFAVESHYLAVEDLNANDVIACVASVSVRFRGKERETRA